MISSAEALEAAQLIDRLGRLVRASEQTGGLYPAQWEALRYLGRANRFSRSPAAVAEFLASTRGTVSRTLASLEAKGLLARDPSRRDGRSIDMGLTTAGEEMLRRDPLLAMAEDIDRVTGRDAAGLLDRLRSTLRAAISRNDGRAFGVCAACRHFRANVRTSAYEPHHCALLDEPLSEADSLAICAEQQAA